MIRPRSYQVLLTPLIAKDTYGTAVDVTGEFEIDDFVNAKGISSINREVDNGDYDFGVFVYDSIKLKFFNLDGKFAPPEDSRSMFIYSRDRAKIKINFFDGENEDSTITFEGLIDERATRMNFKTDEISFTVLSQDSILNRVKVPAGSITNGTAISLAIKNLLRLPEITAVLNYNESNINVQNDYTIDDGDVFDNLIVRKALDQLLSASNSTIIVNKTNDVIVRSRTYNSSSDVFRFFGDGDIFGRENIIEISKYNDGLHRMFNTVTVGGVSVSNPGSIDSEGDNEKRIQFDFITDPQKNFDIATDLLNNWGVKKRELIITARTIDVKNLDFFDLVSIDYPYRTTPESGQELPIYGVQRYGESVYPRIQGNLKIRPNVAFKVIGIKEDPTKFTTQIKLRQTGTRIDDGYFSDIASFYGTAIYGINPYQEDADRVDPNEKSHYGAAEYGVVRYGNI